MQDVYSAEQVTDTDLRRLQGLALSGIEGLFERRPATSGRFRNNLISICLCQGAALHREQTLAGISEPHGVKDLDVWCFFSQVPGFQFPPRWRLELDFGPSHLGRDPSIDARFSGRKVDVMGRDIAFEQGDTPSRMIRRYLTTKPTGSAFYLARRPVIAIWPEGELGTAYWDLSDICNS